MYYIESLNADRTLSYDLETMTPKTVHVGALPQDVLDEENEYLRSSLSGDDGLLKLHQIADNGMIQYKKTRPEASREGVKGAKMIAKQEKGREIHPLIRGLDPKRCHQLLSEKLDYVKMLQTFRPAQTVLETGIGTSAKSSSGAKTVSSAKLTQGVEAMKAFRKTTKSALERNKSPHNHALVLSDDDLNQHEQPNADEYSHGDDAADELDSEDGYGESDTLTTRIESKPRLSRADKKRFRRLGLGIDEQKKYLEQRLNTKSSISDPRINEKNSVNSMIIDEEAFRDSYFMSYGYQNDQQNFVEGALQPLSGLRGAEAQS